MTVRSMPNADDHLSWSALCAEMRTQTGRKDRGGTLTAKARPGAANLPRVVAWRYACAARAHMARRKAPAAVAENKTAGP